MTGPRRRVRVDGRRRLAMPPDGPRCLSRRQVLAGGAGLVGGAWLARGLRVAARTGQVDGPKRIYLALDDHTDYLWTADEATYRQVFLDTLDYYLDLADGTAGEPADFQSRWNCDGSYWLWTYERHRAPADFARLMDRVRDGHINAPLNALVVCLGGAPAEAVLRGLYYAGRLERRYGVRFRLAGAMENQTMPCGLASLFAGAGARYVWHGICGCATKVPNPGDREHEIYWWAGPDGQRVLMKWYSMPAGNQSIGGYAEARYPEALVDYVDQDPGFRRRYPYPVIGAFGKGWDDLATRTDEFVRVARAKSTPQRRVIVSNEVDFFQDFETGHGADLPTVTASFGNEWDTYCATLAEVSARVKRAVEKLRAAEAMLTVAGLHDPAAATAWDDLAPRRAEAHMALGLYWEHDWDPTGAVAADVRAAWQRGLADQIDGYVNAAHAAGVLQLGRLIAGSRRYFRFAAFNPLSWPRTDRVAVTLPPGLDEPLHVVDVATGRQVAHSWVSFLGDPDDPRLLVLATEVPAVGYRVFEVRSGQGERFPQAAISTLRGLENDLLKVSLADNGAIQSWLDRTTANRELVRVHRDRAVNDLGRGTKTEHASPEGPVVSLQRLRVDDPLLPRTTTVIVTTGLNRLEIDNVITRPFSGVPTWGFGFALDRPVIWHEEVGAVIQARLVPDGGHYSPRNARYDWLTLNHFVALSDGAVTITLSNADAYFMRLGDSEVARLDTATPYVAVLAGGHVDRPGGGIPYQGNEPSLRQRFALTCYPGPFDAARSMRFALEHQNPLAGIPLTTLGRMPQDTFSLVDVTAPDVLLWALKPAEEGLAAGVVARLWQLGAAPATVPLRLTGLPLASAAACSHVETDEGPTEVADGALVAALQAGALATFRLRTASGTPTPPPASVTPTRPTPPTSATPPVPTPDATATATTTAAAGKVYLPRTER